MTKHRKTGQRSMGFAALFGSTILFGSAVLFGSTLLMLSGCGNALYAVQSSSAATKLEEAKELGAEEFAPYEYYMAVEHLSKAQTEAAEADYSDAVNYAEISEEHSEKAIRLSRDAHRGSGR